MRLLRERKRERLNIVVLWVLVLIQAVRAGATPLVVLAALGFAHALSQLASAYRRPRINVTITGDARGLTDAIARADEAIGRVVRKHEDR